ncbi:MAG: response regulator [Acidobacteriota bacterium]
MSETDAINTLYLVDDDDAFRDSLAVLCDSVGFEVEEFRSAREFLDGSLDEMNGCVLLDVRMPGMSGVELFSELKSRNFGLPVIFLTGHGDVPMAVSAMKDGAFDFMTKPFSHQELLDRVNAALRSFEEDEEARHGLDDLKERLEQLTPREHEVMGLVVDGLANKVIANRLEISQRTVEIHRARVMEKMQAGSLAELVKMSLRLEN